jgi:hypothetical protein
MYKIKCLEISEIDFLWNLACCEKNSIKVIAVEFQAYFLAYGGNNL